jgi:hypothetical protein
VPGGVLTVRIALPTTSLPLEPGDTYSILHTAPSCLRLLHLFVAFTCTHASLHISGNLQDSTVQHTTCDPQPLVRH